MIEVHNGAAAGRMEEAVLFPFDDHSIPFSAGLRLQLVPGKSPYNMNPIVLGRGEPGEPDDGKVTFYGTVLEFEGELRMWYQAKSSQDRSGRRLCYAVSQDGETWEKPQLGLVEFNGGRDNNIVDLFGGRAVLTSCPILHDPDDPDPQRRFKMCIESSIYRNELAVAYSADGLRWTESPNNPVAPAQETGSVVKVGDCYYVVSQDELGYHVVAVRRRPQDDHLRLVRLRDLDTGFLPGLPARPGRAAAGGARPQRRRGGAPGRDALGSR